MCHKVIRIDILYAEMEWKIQIWKKRKNYNSVQLKV